MGLHVICRPGPYICSEWEWECVKNLKAKRFNLEICKEKNKKRLIDATLTFEVKILAIEWFTLPIQGSIFKAFQKIFYSS